MSLKIKFLKDIKGYKKGETRKISEKQLKEFKNYFIEGKDFEEVIENEEIPNRYFSKGIVPENWTKIKILIDLYGKNFKNAFFKELNKLREEGIDGNKKYIDFEDKYGIKEIISFTYSEADQKAIAKVKEKIKNWKGKKELAKEIYNIKPYFYDSSKIWWIWNKTRKKWEKVDKTDVLNIVSMTSEADTIKSTEKREILEAMEQYGRKKKPKDTPDSWIQFKDTIIDIDNNKSFEASPKYFITNPIPWEIGNNEETPTIDKIFEEWVGKEYKKTLYEIIAYSTLPNYPIHRLFCLVGDGRNGKSCFQRLVKKFIGNDNITSTDLSNLIRSRFEKAKLYKKLVCILGETNFSTITRTSLIKRLTGQDSISFEFKNKDPIDGINYSKILIATNGIPFSEDQSDGFYRRWCIVEFPNKFKNKKDILEDIPKEEYSNLARKSIRILKELLEKRTFHKEGEVKDRKKKYEELSNPISKFIEDMCKKEGEVPFFKFFKELSTFIEGKNYRQLSKIEVSKILNREGFEIKTKRKKKPNGKDTTWKMIIGLDLDYGGRKARYVIERDLSNLCIDKEIKNNKIEDIVIENKENKEVLRLLEKNKYVRKLGKNGEND